MPLFTVVNGGTITVGSGYSPYIYIADVDGVPIGSLQALATGTPTTTYEFPVTLFTNNIIVSVTSTDITSNFNTSFRPVSVKAIVNASGGVSFTGTVKGASSFTSGSTITSTPLPTALRPATAKTFIVPYLYYLTTGTSAPLWTSLMVTLGTDGNMVVNFSTFVYDSSGYQTRTALGDNSANSIDLSGINYNVGY
jgi:hypothetical protein